MISSISTMMDPFWADDLIVPLRQWLSAALSDDDLAMLVPCGDPLRTWWTPQPGDPRLDLLVDVIRGARDALALMAVVQHARTRVAAPSLPREVDLALSAALAALAIQTRRTHRGGEFDAFLSYSHRDGARARAVLAILRNAGLRIFQDVEQIQPGESIVGRLHEVMERVPRAILLVTRSYVRSEWAVREMSVLLSRRADEGMVLLPVLLDDVPLPPAITDTFTVDLRGFRGDEDRAWAEERLQALVRGCTQEQTR